MLVNLIAYGLVASQPAAYLVFLGTAQRALSAPAYVELRQRINPVMSRRLPVLYGVTLVTELVLLVLAQRMGAGIVVVTTALALLCLVADAYFMLRASVPINAVMDRWSTAAYPDDWESSRAQWFAVFRYRQVALLIGFVSLAVGAVH